MYLWNVIFAFNIYIFYGKTSEKVLEWFDFLYIVGGAIHYPDVNCGYITSQYEWGGFYCDKSRPYICEQKGNYAVLYIRRIIVFKTSFNE